MRVIKNFKPTGDKYRDFPIVKIIKGDDVFEDLPLCSVAFGDLSETLVLYIRQNSFNIAISPKELDSILSKLERYVMHNDNGHLTRIEDNAKIDENTVISWLPKDVNVDDLEYKNGEIYLIKKVKEGDE